MASSFDPYHKWLGIPPDEQPPNHYRLLGIRDLEADPDVIQAAADQRMAHLRTYQTGRYADWSQRLLNEVAAAKICLLSPAKKAAYDQQLSDLRTKSGSGSLSPFPSAEGQGEAAWRAAPQRIKLPLSDYPQPGPPPDDGGTGAGDLPTYSKRRLPVAPLIGVLIAVAAAALGGLAYWGIGSRERPATVAKLSIPSPERDQSQNAPPQNGVPRRRKIRPARGFSRIPLSREQERGRG